MGVDTVEIFGLNPTAVFYDSFFYNYLSLNILLLFLINRID